MLCSSCIKLSYSEIIKPCVKCKGNARINIAILCDACSDKDSVCCICLKKTFINSKLNILKSGCRCNST